MPGPDISILIAAYRLRAEVPVAVASVFACAGAARVEVIVASDDGTDYASCLPADPRLRFTETGPVATGAHAARNRALAVARGTFVLILDGDDALEGPPGAMAEALALARRAGCAVVPSLVRAPDGTEVRRVPADNVPSFGLADWRDAFASLHVIAPRDRVAPFRPYRLIDDVLFDLAALVAAGGVGPVARPLAYRYQLRPGQATDTDGGRFDAEYRAALAALAAGDPGYGADGAAVAAVLRRWRAMNRLVGGGGGRPGLGDYHRAVAAYLGGAWPAGRRRRGGDRPAGGIAIRSG